MNALSDRERREAREARCAAWDSEMAGVEFVGHGEGDTCACARCGRSGRDPFLGGTVSFLAGRGAETRREKRLEVCRACYRSLVPDVQVAPCGCSSTGCGCSGKTYCNCTPGACPCAECEV